MFSIVSPEHPDHKVHNLPRTLPKIQLAVLQSVLETNTHISFRQLGGTHHKWGHRHQIPLAVKERKGYETKGGFLKILKRSPYFSPKHAEILNTGI